MATGNDTATREDAAAERAIGYGLSLLKIIGEDRLAYLLQTESDLTLEQAEEFLAMLEAAQPGGAT